MLNLLDHEDDPRVPIGIRLRPLKKGGVSYKRWFLPISYGHLTLREAYHYLQIVAAPQGKIPEIIRWTEGKDSKLVKEFFYGGVDLRAHDFIHILLGRGLLPHDEAFVIGFTMGSTNRLQTLNKEAFAYIAQHHYPNAYRMDEACKVIYMDAAKIGYIMDCKPLDQVDFTPYLDMTIDEVRKRVNLRTGLLDAYYLEIEKNRHPEDPASARLSNRSLSLTAYTFPDEGLQWTLEETAKLRKTELAANDQPPLVDHNALSTALDLQQARITQVLESQADVARMCYEEVANVLGEDELKEKEAFNIGQWKLFHNQALENVQASRIAVEKEVLEMSWADETDSTDLRSLVHTLLGRGGSLRDRAFCRGFFDGSTNQRTTYASDLKLGILAEMAISRDGLYDEELCQIYHKGAKMGYVSDCTPLHEVDFNGLLNLPLHEARKHIGLTTGILKAYKSEIEDQRLLL